MHLDDIIVSTSDDLLGTELRRRFRPRFFGDFKPTNAPLSRSEIEKDEAKDTAHRGWAPRTLENIGELTPIPESEAPTVSRGFHSGYTEKEWKKRS